MDTVSKYCPRCQQTKSIVEFYWNRKRKYWSSYCKFCSKSYNNDNQKNFPVNVPGKREQKVAAAVAKQNALLEERFRKQKERTDVRQHRKDNQGPKTCTQCNQEKPLDLFVKQSSKSDGRSAHCKECHRWSSIEKKYNLTKDQFMELWESQDWKCALCKGTDWSGAGKQYPHVDHCHETGRVRGLLCNQCNSRMLPILELKFSEDRKLLLSAIVRYIKSEPLYYIDQERQHPISKSSNSRKDTQHIYDGSKQCTGRYGCYIWKPLEKFRKIKNSWCPYCRNCNSKVRLWTTYRLLPSDVQQILDFQNHKCIICLTPNPTDIDHCHKTNAIRGILCNPCNNRLLPSFEQTENLNEFGSSVFKYLDNSY